MIDRAVWRELAALLYERAENPNQKLRDRDNFLLGDEPEEPAGMPVTGWYDALRPQRSAFSVTIEPPPAASPRHLRRYTVGEAGMASEFLNVAETPAALDDFARGLGDECSAPEV